MKKKYFIGFALKENAYDYSLHIADGLNHRYNVKNQFYKYPPHITLKISFFATDMELNQDLVPYLEKFVIGRNPISLEVKGFGHFNTGVIFRDILQNDSSLTVLQRELCDGLEEHLKWVTFYDIEPNGIPRVTLGEDDVSGRFKSIYLSLIDKFPEGQEFDLDALELFEKQDDKRWIVIKQFPFKN